MHYNVAELLRGPVGQTRRFVIDEEPGFNLEAATLVGPVRGTVELMRTQQGVLVETELSATAQLPCSRCLEVAQVLITVSFTDEYLQLTDIRTGHRLDLAPGEVIDEELVLGEDHVLVLDEAARQELEAAVPARCLCDVTCAGLCPKCGQNLNDGSCNCEEELDERWSALRDAFSEDTTP